MRFSAFQRGDTNNAAKRGGGGATSVGNGTSKVQRGGRSEVDTDEDREAVSGTFAILANGLCANKWGGSGDGIRHGLAVVYADASASGRAGRCGRFKVAD